MKKPRLQRKKAKMLGASGGHQEDTEMTRQLEDTIVRVLADKLGNTPFNESGFKTPYEWLEGDRPCGLGLTREQARIILRTIELIHLEDFRRKERDRWGEAKGSPTNNPQR
jgi:hypothetical protein